MSYEHNDELTAHVERSETELQALYLRWEHGEPIPVDVEAKAVAAGYDVETLRTPFH